MENSYVELIADVPSGCMDLGSVEIPTALMASTKI